MRALPPSPIRTPRLLLRCWTPDDAAAAQAAVTASLDALRPWMPWAKDEPEAPSAKARRFGGFQRKFERGRDFGFGVFDPAGREVLGGAGLHTAVGAGAFEIGSWIRTDRTGRGLATEAAPALARVAFERCGARLVEIHCHPRNAASAAIPRKLGFAHRDTVSRCAPRRRSAPDETMLWGLTRAGVAGSPVVAAPYDVDGDQPG